MKSLLKPRRGTGRPLTAVLACGLAAALIVSYVRPATAADAVTFSDAQVSNVLFAGAVRIMEAGQDYDRAAVLSAETLDWRARNSEASPATVAAHFAAIEQAVDRVTPLQREGAADEVLRLQLKAVYGTPGAVITGPLMTNLLAAVTGRDLTAGILRVEQRLTGSQQHFGIAVGLSEVQWRLWSEVRSRSLVDTTLRDAWRASLGKPTNDYRDGLDPTWSLPSLKNFGTLKNLDTDGLREAAKTSGPAFLTQAQKALKDLQDKLGGEDSKLRDKINDRLRDAGLPASMTQGPTDAQLAQGRKDQAGRQGTLDGIKGGLDAVTGLVSLFDSSLGKKVGAVVEVAYKVATEVNKLYTSIATLAASTGIGAGTLGPVGAAIGAVIGLIQIGFALFGGDSAGQAQQAMMQQIRQGFEMTRSYLEAIHTAMNKRFDRIDAALNSIYDRMMTNFAKVIELLYTVDGHLEGVHDQLLGLAAEVQAFNAALLGAVADTDKNAFTEMAQTYIDYQRRTGNPIANFQTGDPNYWNPASNFTQAASSVSRHGGFQNRGDAQQNALDVINTWGPAGSIDFLAKRAAAYGLPVSVSSERTPNPDVWAEAARAYTLLAFQNLNFAGQEEAQGGLNGNQIEANGRVISETVAQFSRPEDPPGGGQWTGVNNLFTNLLRENGILRTAFANSLRELETDSSVMRPDRQFDLFGGVRQDISDANLAKILTDDKTKLKVVPATTGKCDNAATAVTTPASVVGKNLPKALLLGLYADPNNGWTYGVCWTKPRYEGINLFTVPENVTDPETGEVIDTRYWHTQYGYLTVDFNESVAVPAQYAGGGSILGRTTAVEDTKSVQLCRWRDGEEFPEGRPPSCAANAAKAPEFAAAANYTKARSTASVSGAGDAQTARLLELRTANYFGVVATKLGTNALTSAQALNENARLIQAYTDLGFPRAKQTDDQLRALVYGTNALPANLKDVPMLQDIYALSAQKLRAGKPLFADQPQLEPQSASGCPSAGLVTKDPVAACVVWIGQQRSTSLFKRYQLHFLAIYHKEESQSPPLVDEVITNLELVRQYVLAYKAASAPHPSTAPARSSARRQTTSAEDVRPAPAPAPAPRPAPRG
jgi:hypothetical protein